ncbi:MAG: bactofilin family protein [Alphaproteobacteria bacterium]
MTLSTSQRPLPAGVVGLSQAGRGPRQERREAAASGTLLVGQAIKIKGQIESCHNLVVEGRVEAELTAKALSVLKGGLFKGTAEVDKADIAGTFEGTLTVHGMLSIKGDGKATGHIRYQRITIEGGGEISGDVEIGTEVAVGAAAVTPAKRNKDHVA